MNGTDTGDALGCVTGIGVWYKIEPSTSQTYEIVISNASYTHEVAIAEGTACGNFTNLYCRIGFSGDTKHYFFGEAGKEYYMYIGLSLIHI